MNEIITTYTEVYYKRSMRQSEYASQRKTTSEANEGALSELLKNALLLFTIFFLLKKYSSLLD